MKVDPVKPAGFLASIISHFLFLSRPSTGSRSKENASRRLSDSWSLLSGASVMHSDIWSSNFLCNLQITGIWLMKKIYLDQMESIRIPSTKRAD